MRKGAPPRLDADVATPSLAPLLQPQIQANTPLPRNRATDLGRRAAVVPPRGLRESHRRAAAALLAGRVASPLQGGLQGDARRRAAGKRRGRRRRRWRREGRAGVDAGAARVNGAALLGQVEGRSSPGPGCSPFVYSHIQKADWRRWLRKTRHQLVPTLVMRLNKSRHQ